jgi:hypothetical protein
MYVPCFIKNKQNYFSLLDERFCSMNQNKEQYAVFILVQENCCIITIYEDLLLAPAAADRLGSPAG